MLGGIVAQFSERVEYQSAQVSCHRLVCAETLEGVIRQLFNLGYVTEPLQSHDDLRTVCGSRGSCINRYAHLFQHGEEPLGGQFGAERCIIGRLHPASYPLQPNE